MASLRGGKHLEKTEGRQPETKPDENLVEERRKQEKSDYTMN